MISVISIAHNQKECTQMFLKSLSNPLCADQEFELVFIDNGSSDETRLLVKNFPLHDNPYFCGLTLHSFEKNCGVAAAVNVGAKLAKGEVLLQADNDVVFGYQSFSGLLEWFQTAPAGIVSPNWPWVQKLLGLEYFHSENDFTKKKFTYLKKVGSRAPLERGRATGSCWICSKKLFERVGGWDENFKNICASDDFRWKIAMCGVELLTVPVGIFHPGKKTRVQIKNNSAQQARDIAFFIEKWGAHPENIAHLNRLLEEKGFSPAQTVTAAYPSLLERLASFFFR